MKKRNKRLGLLTAMVALSLSGVSKTAAALTFNQADLLNGGLGVVNDLNVATLSASETTPIWDINRDEGVMDALDINGEDGAFSFVLVAPEGWYLDSFSLVYRDYEQGITAEEADEAARTLGEDDARWAVVVANKSYLANLTSGGFVQVGLKSKTLMSDNLTNEFYYAIKLINLENPTEYVWKRGKLSYRRCAKTPGFQDKIMQCSMPLKDGYYTPTLKKTFRYGNTYLEMIDEDDIEDWDTEWSKVLLGRYEQVATLLGQTEDHLKNFFDNMNSAAETLSGLEKTQNSASGLEVIVDGLDGLKNQLQSLREYYASLQGELGDCVDSDELLTLQKQNQDLTTTNSDLTATNRALEEQNANLLAKIAELTSERDNLVEKNAMLEEEKAELLEQTEELKSEVESLKSTTDVDLRDKVAVLEGEKEDLVSANRSLESERKTLLERVENLVMQLTEKEQQNLELQRKIDEGEECVAQAASIVDGSASNLVDTAVDSSVNDDAITGTEVDALTTVVSYNSDNAISIDDHEGDEAAVPKLGGSNLNVWLGIALLTLALGILLLWLKHTFAR